MNRHSGPLPHTHCPSTQLSNLPGVHWAASQSHIPSPGLHVLLPGQGGPTPQAQLLLAQWSALAGSQSALQAAPSAWAQLG
jgi:hypothetical protein